MTAFDPYLFPPASDSPAPEGEVKAFDPYCKRSADEIPGVVEFAKMEDMTPDEWVKSEEGTYNPSNGHFACDTCYIKLGMPSSPSGWRAE